jgi:UPF0755 protein
MAAIKKIIVYLVLLAFSATAFVVFWSREPLTAADSMPVEFTIKPGSSVRSAARDMRDAGVPATPELMELLARVLGKAGSIKAGSYQLRPGSTPLALLDMLVRGETIQESLTIIEGWTFAQMRAEVARHKWLRHDSAELGEQEFMAKVAPGYDKPEGLFYPDTYLFARGSSDLLLYQQAHAQMKKVLEQTWARRSPDVPYKSPYEALIMASIVEKETGLQTERKQIAAVFVNRLKRGMLLQTDPTVIYGMGERFDGNIRKQDLLTDSAYNTYLRSGLPPTPIALAGSAALEAALNPAPTSDLFFVARGDGSSQFSESLADHNKAVNKYQR